MREYAEPPQNSDSASSPIYYAHYHRNVAKHVLDIGLLASYVTAPLLLVSTRSLVELSAFTAITLAVIATGLYLPAYFIGQELFDATGHAILPFIYLNLFGITFSTLPFILLGPQTYRLAIYLGLLITITGGRIEIEGFPRF